MDKQLHEADEEPEPMFQPGRLISLLEIIGGGTMTCDGCLRWQKVAGLSADAVRAELVADGWSFADGQDFCPICAAESGASVQKPSEHGRILGAEFARLADVMEPLHPEIPPRCKTCAFRKGTMPNQMAGTLSEALDWRLCT